MAKPQVATRVDTGTKRSVEEYAEEKDITEAEAMRRLLSRGLDYEAGRLTATDGGEVREATEELYQNLARTIRLQTFRDAGVALGLVLAIGELAGLLDTTASVALGLAALVLLAYPTLEQHRSTRNGDTPDAGAVERGES